MREIKKTFPDRELLEMSNSVNGALLEVDEELEDEKEPTVPYASVTADETLQQSPPIPPSPPEMTYSDISQSSIQPQNLNSKFHYASAMEATPRNVTPSIPELAQEVAQGLNR